MKDKNQVLKEHEFTEKKINKLEQTLNWLYVAHNKVLNDSVSETDTQKFTFEVTKNKNSESILDFNLLSNNSVTIKTGKVTQSQRLMFSASASKELIYTDIIKNICKSGDVEQFDKIMEKITEFNHYDKTGYSPLMYAISNKFLHGIDKLFNKNVLLSEKDVFVLIQNYGSSFVRKVVDEFSVKTLPLSLKNFLIQDACINQQKETFDEVFANIVNINAQNYEGKTALIHATENNFMYAFDRLLESKAEARIKDNTGNNALHIALLLKNNKIAEVLIHYDKAIISDKGAQGKIPLYLALEQNNKPLVKTLFNEASFNDSLVYAIKNGNYKVAKNIIDEDKKLVHLHEDKKSLLSIALEYNNLHGAQLLLYFGADFAKALDNKDIIHINMSNFGQKQDKPTCFFQMKRASNRHDTLKGLDGECIKLIASKLSTSDVITQLSLQNTYVAPESMMILINAIKHCSSLRKLNLAHTILGQEGMKSLANILIESNVLLALDISHNNLGDEGIVPVYSVLKSSKSLMTLNIAGNNIKDSGIIELNNILQSNNTLLKLDISRNSIIEKGLIEIANMLKVNKTLLSLDIGSQNLLQPTIWNSTIWNSFIGLRDGNIKYLDLSYSKIQDSAMKTLAPVIRGLKYLNLTYTNLRDEGAHYIAKALEEGTSLNILILNDNIFSDEGALKIISALHNNYTLHSLSLNQIYSIIKCDSDSEKIISALISNVSLSKLGLLCGNFNINDVVNLLNKNKNITSLSLDLEYNSYYMAYKTESKDVSIIAEALLNSNVITFNAPTTSQIINNSLLCNIFKVKNKLINLETKNTKDLTAKDLYQLYHQLIELYCLSKSGEIIKTEIAKQKLSNISYQEVKDALIQIDRLFKEIKQNEVQCFNKADTFIDVVKHIDVLGSVEVPFDWFDWWEFTPECSMATMDEPVIKSLI